MKKTFAILGVVAAGFGASSLQAAPDIVKVSSTAKAAAKPRHSTIYITSVTAVGSHIPLVVRRYDGVIIAMSPTYAYGKADIVETGSSSDTATALALRDPSITFNRH